MFTVSACHRSCAQIGGCRRCRCLGVAGADWGVGPSSARDTGGPARPWSAPIRVGRGCLRELTDRSLNTREGGGGYKMGGGLSEVKFYLYTKGTVEGRGSFSHAKGGCGAQSVLR